MFTYSVSDSLQQEIDMCLKNVHSINIPIAESISFIECDGYSRCGWCSKNNNGYVIAVNKNIVFEKDLKETIIHELLHTIDGCLGHNKSWKKYADICSKKFGIEIQTKGSVFMKSITPDYTEPNIPIRHIKFENQLDYIKELIHNNKEYLFSNITQICCYLSQENRDYLFIYLREKEPHLFFDKTPNSVGDVIDRFASEKAKHKLANNYLAGQYDYLQFNYPQWVNFSSIWALTKDYVNCNEKYTKEMREVNYGKC